MPPAQSVPLPVGRQQPGLLLPRRPDSGHDWNPKRTSGELALHGRVGAAAAQELGQAEASEAHFVRDAQRAREAHDAGEHQGRADRAG